MELPTLTVTKFTESDNSQHVEITNYDIDNLITEDSARIIAGTVQFGKLELHHHDIGFWCFKVVK